MYRLTRQQITELAGMISETNGNSLTKQQFAEALHLLFEDISGLEALQHDAARKYINTGWRIYCEQTRQ